MSVQGPLGATESGVIEIRTRGIRARGIATRARVLSDRAGVVAIGGLILTTLLVALSAAQTNTLLPETLRPLPSFLAGPFGTTGIDLGNYGLIAVLGVMLVCYAVAFQAADRLSARTVLIGIVAMHALILLAPPLLSTDIFSYQFYGRMQDLYGFNPYLAGPHALQLDPLFQYIGWRWINTPSVYGPLFTELSYVLAPLSIATSVFVYKGIAAAASLGTIALVWNSAKLRGINPVKAAALVGLNPLVVIWGVGGGHNDLLMMVLLMAGVYLMLSRKERAGGALMVVACAIKLTAGVILALAIANDGGRNARGHRRNVVVGAAAAGVLLVGLSFLWFGTGPLHLLGTLRKVQSEGDWHSIPGFAGRVFGGTTGHVVGIVLGVMFAFVCAALLWKTWKGRIDWINAGAWVALALLISSSSLLPWYVVWLLPLAALATDRRLWQVAIIATCVVGALQLVGYIPHVTLF